MHELRRKLKDLGFERAYDISDDDLRKLIDAWALVVVNTMTAARNIALVALESSILLGAFDENDSGGEDGDEPSPEVSGSEEQFYG